MMRVYPGLLPSQMTSDSLSRCAQCCVMLSIAYLTPTNAQQDRHKEVRTMHSITLAVVLDETTNTSCRQSLFTRRTVLFSTRVRSSSWP
jgi:hypothetical protein